MPTSATPDPPPTHENQGRHFRQRTIGITPFEQAQRSWARPIASYKELPAEFREWFEPEHAGAPFPLAVLTPSFEGFLHHEIERLVCATSEAVTILERRGRRVEVRRYPIDEISLVEVSSVLLDARLRIDGREGGSDRVSST
ncbi:MAG TPA: hypothetical protein VK449_10370, partial [Anaerolineales bacterium]|nr:hypothetical protein [Anaerolineales bacterium]